MEGNFQFTVGDVVLAEWTDKLFYAKILHIDGVQLVCTLLFDDDSVEECPISKIHSVTETTADIVCIICKDGSSCKPNEIVLCDKCGIGYHQRCHEPFIKDNALEPDAPWMCVYCTNGTECPYLLNPFEAKMTNFTSSSRKQRGLTKDIQYSSERKVDFGNNNKSERTGMDDYYDGGNHLHSEMSTTTARHMIGDRHVMSRRAMVEQQMSGNHGNRFHKAYKYPKTYDGSRERLHYPQMEAVAKQRQIVQHENETQDVWDNGCTSPRDTMRNSERFDGKAAGKDGPREKQRLTQDLERQRKKLKEDMERGEELEREHSQLLTRDHCRVKQDTTTEDIKKRDLEESRRYEKTLYLRGREWSGQFRTEKMSVRNSREKPSENMNEISRDNNTRLVKQRNANINENDSLQQTRPGDDELDKGEPRRKLDSCGCEGSEEHSSGNQGENRAENEGTEGDISETQCEHSTSHHPHTGDTNELMYENISPPSSNERGDMVIELREEATQGTRENVNGVHDQVFTSEKVEVIGRSDELGSSCSQEEITKESQSAKGRTKRQQGKGRSQKRYQKSLEKSNNENTVEKNEGSLHENSTAEKTTEGEHNGIARTDGSREGSRRFNRRSTSHGDNDIVEEGKSKERTKSKSHSTTHEGGSKNDDDEVQNGITQNRVRSDLPRHNWLIERLRNEKKLPSGGCGSSDDLKEKKATSEEVLVDSKLEVTSKPEDNGLKKTHVRSTTSPVLEDKAKEVDVEDKMESNCRETSYVDDNNKKEDFEQSEVGSPNYKMLSPKSERNSPHNMSPELKRYSPALVPASPCEDDELQNGPSPILEVPEITRSTLGAKGISGESGNDEMSVENKTFLLDNLEGSDKAEKQSVEENVENFQIMEKRETGAEDENIIEITSDGEGHDDKKQIDDTISKISTGKSVNPVSPFLRSERRSMEELQTGQKTGLRHHAMRSPRFPVDLPSSLPFMKPGYIPPPGYPSRMFTPHLFTHNPSGLSKPVSPISGHAGHAGYLSARLDLGHSKPDHDCPYHGKKATDKLNQHVPGYPMMHSDHHYLNRIPFHDGVPPDFALHEKLREHVQVVGDPLGFHRRLPSVYDRHFMMPHGMPSHVFPSRYMQPRLLDEHLLHLDRERFERRMFPLHEPPKHARSGPPEEHRNAPKCAASPSEEKRDASKHIATPSGEYRNVSKHIDSPSFDSEKEPTKSKPLLETTAGHYHSGHLQDELPVSRQRSPDEVKYLKGEQLKSGKHSPHTDAPYTTPPPNKETNDYRSPFINLGRPKIVEGKPGNDRNSLDLTRSQPPHDQEAISRDFQERLNMLNKKFIKGLEAMGKPGDERSYKAATSLYPDDKVPSGYRIPGAEFVHHGARVDHVADGTTRPLSADNAPLLSRQSGPSKYSNHDNQRPPAARSSSPGLRANDRGEQDIKRDATIRSLLNTSSHKPPLPMTSYRPPHGNAISIPRAHGLHARDEMKKSPGTHALLHLARQGEHPHHEHMAWSLRSPRPLTSYPLTSRINPKVHQKPTMENSNKSEQHLSSIKQELEEKEITLAREKHLINLAHLENERRKAIMSNELPHPRLPSRGDERKEEQTRPDKTEKAHQGPREDALRKDWEEPELSRKRKYEEMRAMHDGISPLGKTTSDQNKRLKRVPMDGRIPSHNTLHQHIHEDFNSRKDRYLSMYRGDPYGHVTTVAHAGRGRNVGNTPFYMGRFDLQRSKPEQSMELRKAKEINEDIIPDEKQNNDKDTTESAKKRPKTQKLCDVCRKEASFLCSGCEKAWYCSAECQFKVWTEHSKECIQGKRR